MDERPRSGTQPHGTPGRAQVAGYGLLAIAVAVGVLYLDGQRPRDIATIAVAILALLGTLVWIAPRFGEPERRDEPDDSDTDSGTRSDGDPPAGQASPGRRTKRGRRRR